MLLVSLAVLVLDIWGRDGHRRWHGGVVGTRRGSRCCVAIRRAYLFCWTCTWVDKFNAFSPPRGHSGVAAWHTDTQMAMIKADRMASRCLSLICPHGPQPGSMDNSDECDADRPAIITLWKTLLSASTTLQPFQRVGRISPEGARKLHELHREAYREQDCR